MGDNIIEAVAAIHEINSLYQDIEEALQQAMDPREREEAIDKIFAANRKIGEITKEWI
jgi:hypothetical protein